VKKSLPLISVVLLAAFPVSLFVYPSISNRLGSALVIISLGMASIFIIGNHAQALMLGRISGSKFVRNILLDVLGLFITIVAASYLGRLAGSWLGVSFGFWVGMLIGLGTAFLLEMPFSNFRPPSVIQTP